MSDDETRFMGMTVAVANKIIIKSIPGHMETCWSQPHEQYVLRSVGKSFRAGGEFNLCAFSSFLFHFSLSRASSDDNHLRFIEKLSNRESLAESWITIFRRLFLRCRSLISLPLFDRCNQTRIVFDVNGGITSSWVPRTCSMGAASSWCIALD